MTGEAGAAASGLAIAAARNAAASFMAAALDVGSEGDDIAALACGKAVEGLLRRGDDQRPVATVLAGGAGPAQLPALLFELQTEKGDGLLDGDGLLQSS